MQVVYYQLSDLVGGRGTIHAKLQFELMALQ